MGSKILAQTGTSLADVYDIEGSIVGVDELEAHEVNVVHDLGPQIQSERLRSFIEVIDGGVVAQNITWGVALLPFPDCVNRIVTISVVSDVDSRILNCSVALKEGSSAIEYPLWVWDQTDDETSPYIWDDGSGSAVFNMMRPIHNLPGGVPCIATRGGDASDMPNLIFRGTSTGFGAGDVRARAIIQVIRPTSRVPAAGEPSSHGLPFPSW